MPVKYTNEKDHNNNDRTPQQKGSNSFDFLGGLKKLSKERPISEQLPEQYGPGIKKFYDDKISPALERIRQFQKQHKLFIKNGNKIIRAQTGDKLLNLSNLSQRGAWEEASRKGVSRYIYKDRVLDTLKNVTYNNYWDTQAKKFGLKDIDSVKKLQQVMKDYGYYNGEVDGKFGLYSQEAYKNFMDKEKNNLTLAPELNPAVINEEQKSKEAKEFIIPHKDDKDFGRRLWFFYNFNK